MRIGDECIEMPDTAVTCDSRGAEFAGLDVGDHPGGHSTTFCGGSSAGRQDAAC
jgi:hypothetical protein